MNHLDTNNRERYSRQMLLPEFSLEKQKRLAEKKVAIVGMGALGTVAAELLVRSGVLHLLLVDRDIVELSNLQRQVLYQERDLGKSKVVAAQDSLNGINSNTIIDIEAIDLSPKNIYLLLDYDLILDCTDNLKTRFMLNDFCRKERIAWIYASAIRTAGYVMPIFPNGPCLGCFLQPVSGETCDTVGVLNTATASVAAQQATMALQILIGIDVKSELLFCDVWNHEQRKIIVPRRAECKTCRGIYEFLAPVTEPKRIHFCLTGVYQFEGKKVNLNELKDRWERVDAVHEDAATIRFKQITVFKDGRVLMKANSEQEAEALFSKWIGN